MAQFQQVQRIYINKNKPNDINSISQQLSSSSSDISKPNRYIIQLKISGTSELLSINCPSFIIAQNIAYLIDGYCKLVFGSSKSFWIPKGK